MTVACRGSLLLSLLSAVGACGTTTKTSPVKALSGDVTLPKIAHREEPIYPVEARAFEAEVLLKVGVDKTGHVRRVEVIRSGGTMFDDAARAAMFKTTFVPGEHNGQPVDCYITFTYIFKLPARE